MSDRHQKPKTRTNTGFTKAGRNSRSGGKNRHADRKAALRLTRNSKSVLELRVDDLRQEALQRAAEERRLKAAKQLEFRKRQATMAMTLLDLRKGSLSMRVASLMIEAFPTATPVHGSSRHKVAEASMMTMLSGDEVSRTAAVTHGVRTANRALYRAFELIGTKAPKPLPLEQKELIGA
jgi:predicted DNA repair protein MutK